MSAFYPSISYPPKGSSLETHYKKNRNIPSRSKSPLSREPLDFEYRSSDRDPIQKISIDFLEKSAREWRSSELDRRARKFFKTLPPLKPVSCALSGEDFPAILKEIFMQGCSGVCLGEYHNQRTSKTLLIDNMGLLKALDISILFIENIKADLYQDKLDLWFQTPHAPLPQELAVCLEKLDAKYDLADPYTYTNLVLEAKKAGIRVVGIDTSTSAIAGNPSNLSIPSHISKMQRIKATNFEAQKTIKEQAQGCRYIILTGVDHGSTLRTSKEIPGISELVQCPFLIVADASEFAPASVIHEPQSPYQLGYLNEPGTVHALITIDAPLSSPRRNTI